jgi:hypothetical protein
MEHLQLRKQKLAELISMDHHKGGVLSENFVMQAHRKLNFQLQL